AGTLQLGEERLQIVEVDRLDQVAVASGLLRSRAVDLLAPAGEGDDLHIPSPRLLSDEARRLVAVELGHSDVHQDRLRAESFRELYRLDAVVCRANLVAQELEHLGHR